jgi:hypothetical protein
MENVGMSVGYRFRPFHTHNPEVVGSNPAPATIDIRGLDANLSSFFMSFHSQILHFFLHISSLSPLTSTPPSFCYDMTNTYGLCNNPSARATPHPTYQNTQNIKHNKMKIKQNQRKSKHSQDLTCGECYTQYPLSTLTLRIHHQITATILAHLTGNL